jgi:hypothetical protein
MLQRKKEYAALQALLRRHPVVAIVGARQVGQDHAGPPIVGPGLPPCVKESADFITTDCVQPPVL